MAEMKTVPHHFTTIKDIARNLNISVSTVSRALRDTHDVNPETKERVLAMANELNYKPNFNAKGLAHRRTHNIGIILPFITNYYFSTVITGMQEVAYSNSFNITLYVTNDDAARECDILNNLPLAGMDGLLVSLSGSADSYPQYQKLIDLGIPVVFFDRVAPGIKTSKVMQDDFNGACEAVEHLFRAGYRKIAHLGGPEGLALSEKRKQGYLAALQKFKLPVQQEWIMQSGFSQEQGEKDMLQLLNGKTLPDAVFAINDRKAVGAMITLKQKGITIGKEIGVIGFTNDPVAALVTPSLSTIAEPAFEIGKKSCELLLKHIAKRNFIPEEIVLPGKLITRESTRRG